MKQLQSTVNIVMYGLLLFLLSHATVRSLQWHAYAGIAFFVLCCAHIYWMKGFFLSIHKGSYSIYRIALLTVALLLAITLVLLLSASIYAAGYVFPSITLRFSVPMRSMHLMTASWLFILASLHIALQPMARLNQFEQSCSAHTALRVCLLTFYGLVLSLGCLGLWHSELTAFLFCQSLWKMSQASFLIAIADYGAITLGMIALVRLVYQLKSSHSALV